MIKNPKYLVTEAYRIGNQTYLFLQPISGSLSLDDHIIGEIREIHDETQTGFKDATELNQVRRLLEYFSSNVEGILVSWREKRIKQVAGKPEWYQLPPSGGYKSGQLLISLPKRAIPYNPPNNDEEASTDDVTQPEKPLTEDEVKKYEGLVRRTAFRVFSERGWSYLLEDRMSEGWIGLIDAKQRHREELGDFRRYASSRIRGVILDAGRELDPYSRVFHSQEEEYTQSLFQLGLELGQRPAKEDVYERLGWSPQVIKNFELLVSSDTLSLDKILDNPHQEEEMRMSSAFSSNGFESAHDVVGMEEVSTALHKSLLELTKRQRSAVLLHDYAELTFVEVGKVMISCRSAACQLYQRAINSLRTLMSDFVG